VVRKLVSVSLALVTSASTLSLSALGPVLFLGGNEPQTTTVLPDNPGSLDALAAQSLHYLESRHAYSLITTFSRAWAAAWHLTHQNTASSIWPHQYTLSS
jgi:hypothetical protein